MDGDRPDAAGTARVRFHRPRHSLEGGGLYCGAYVTNDVTHRHDIQGCVQAGEGIKVEGGGDYRVFRNTTGWNGGLGIASPVVVVSNANWAGGNGDTLGCAGVVCRLSRSCGTE